eukprot:873923-Amphidinium_carterae.1
MRLTWHRERVLSKYRALVASLYGEDKSTLGVELGGGEEQENKLATQSTQGFDFGGCQQLYLRVGSDYKGLSRPGFGGCGGEENTLAIQSTLCFDFGGCK